MDLDVTYADLKFPTNNQTAGKETGETKISQGQNKVLSTKILLASTLVICFLLVSTVIALIILYSQSLSKCSLSEMHMEELQQNYNKSLEYIGCKNRTSGKHCGQYFLPPLCPADWIIHNGSCYYFSQQMKSWDSSQSACRALQADLLIINDRMEQEFIRSIQLDGSHWIGLSDREEEEHWKWMNDVSLGSEKFWTLRQPDDSQGMEDCATVVSADESEATNNWNDDQCQKVLKYICEKEAEDKKIDFTLLTTKQEK